jgi:hypothetical protein
MTVIVNLSTLHTSYPIHHSLGAFTRLYDRYAGGCCRGGFFQSKINSFEVVNHYLWNVDLINQYNQGRIDTQEFLEQLLAIFNFLDAEEVVDRERADLTKDTWSQDPRLAVLEEAYNTTIGLDANITHRFPRLDEIAIVQPVYIISNTTNELNVRKIINLLKKKNPSIKFCDPIDLSVKDDKQPIEIAQNIFLCLSYRYQLDKTQDQNPDSSRSLLHYLVNHQLQSVSKSRISVVSQEEGERVEARNLGIPEAAIRTAEEFFEGLSFGSYMNL